MNDSKMTIATININKNVIHRNIRYFFPKQHKTNPLVEETGKVNIYLLQKPPGPKFINATANTAHRGKILTDRTDRGIYFFR